MRVCWLKVGGRGVVWARVNVLAQGSVGESGGAG